MMASRLKGLLLDFGGVIFKSFFETKIHFEELLGLPRNTFGWYGPFDPDRDRLWQKVLAKEISEGDYWAKQAEQAGRLIGEHWTIKEFCRRHSELALDVVFRPEVKLLISQAKHAGIRLAIVTNELEALNGAEWVRNNPVIRQFDALIDATRTKISKPDPRAYRLALEALEIDGEDAIFIDDQIKYVRGAEAVGIRSIHLDITNSKAAFDSARVLLGLGCNT